MMILPLLFLLRVRLYLQRNETSVKEKRCFWENPEPSPRLPGQREWAAAWFHSFPISMQSCSCLCPTHHSLALTERRWTGCAKPPICTGFTLSLFSVGKNPYKIHYYNWNPEDLSMNTHISSAMAELCFLIPIPPAMLPSKGQDRLFYNNVMCV